MTEPAVTPPASISAPAGEFRVGRVLSSAFSLLFRNLPQFGMLSAIASLPYLAILLGDRADVMDVAAAESFGSRGYFLQLFLNPILTALCQSMVIFGVFQAMRGRPFLISESLSKGLARFFPVLGTAVLSSLAIGLATLALVVPGLIVTCMLYVALPVCVVEQRGVNDSLGRSSDLTKGFRWQIFGLTFLLGICILVMSVVIGALLALFGNSTVITIGGYLWETLSRAILALVAVVAYHELRVAKEGVDIDHIASVFD